MVIVNFAQNIIVHKQIALNLCPLTVSMYAGLFMLAILFWGGRENDFILQKKYRRLKLFIMLKQDLYDIDYGQKFEL